MCSSDLPCLSACLSACLPACLSACLSVCLPVCPGQSRMSSSLQRTWPQSMEIAPLHPSCPPGLNTSWGMSNADGWGSGEEYSFLSLYRSLLFGSTLFCLVLLCSVWFYSVLFGSTLFCLVLLCCLMRCFLLFFPLLSFL